MYWSHLSCLLPHGGPGRKHDRPIALEGWQWQLVAAEPWRFLRGCIRSDGSSFTNRTGPYEYLSYEFTNHSPDILGLFVVACKMAGVHDYRRYARQVRINRRGSVAAFEEHVGVKR